MADGPDRQTELTIDLSEQVNLIRITSSEGLSQHFNTTIDLIAPLGEIDFLKHLGKPAAVKVSEDDEELRYFHGLIADAEFLGELETRGFLYRLTLKPAAYFHSQGRNFRVFQNKKTQEIIDAVLKGCNIKADLTKMTDTTPQRAYCVQYGESDFGFVSRLMEEEGLYYFYKHGATEHMLMVCDAPGSHEEAPKASPLTFSETSYRVFNVNSATRYEGGKKYLHEWRERVSTGAEHKVTLRDFDFMVSDKVEGDNDSQEEYSFEGVEFYNYPARTFDNDVSKKRSGVLLESRRANRRTYVGESGNAAIQCGTTFKLEDHPIERFNGKSYLVAQTHHVISSETYASSMGEDSAHAIQIEAVPAEVKWRAPMKSRRPVVLGPETAWVTGPTAEEIFTDEHGRVKIQFHWDREGQLDENSSCWVRVSQTGGLGNLIMPRVGHEVLVDFIDGDPDRPIVVGRVFNSTHRPVYALPEHMTRALWRSKTHKNDKPNTYGQSWVGVPNIGGNEISMEDTDGAEELLVYGQKDMLTKVQNDVAHHFGNDHDVKIGNNRAMKIGKDDTIEVVGNRETKIQENETREIKGKRETKVTQSELLDVSKDITVKAATEILIKAEVSITLQCGGSKITMMPNLIQVKTDTLTTDGSLLAEHKGGGNKIQMMPGIMIINGTLIMIN